MYAFAVGLKYANLSNIMLGISNSFFENTNSSFENTNSSFENTNSSFENTNSSFENMNSSFDNTNSSFENTNSSFENTNSTPLVTITLYAYILVCFLVPLAPKQHKVSATGFQSMSTLHYQRERRGLDDRTKNCACRVCSTRIFVREMPSVNLIHF